jgi:hypothetical protein
VKGRSPLWWKSGRVLAWVWVLGSLLVAGATLPFLYQQWVEVRELVTQYQAMSAYVETHRETLESSDLSDPPTPDALSILADKVPPDRDVSRLLLQLRDAAEAAGVKLNAVRIADDPEELDRLFDEKEENGKQSGSKKEKPPEEMSGKPSEIPHVEPVWLEVYLSAEIPGLKKWFRQLHQLPRIVSVQEWEHRLESRPGYGNARIRLLTYAYLDPELKELSPKHPPEISREPGDPVRVRPKSDKKGRSSRP